MIGWFVGWLERWVKLGLDLAFALIAGILGAPFRAAGPRIRAAGPADVVDVRHRVLREGQPRATAVFDGDGAPTTRHWVAEVDGRVVGVVTVVASPMPDVPLDRSGLASPEVAAPPGLQLRGMAVLPEQRGKGIGDALLRTVHADVAAPMWCNARAGVVAFYAHAGWRPVGAVFDLPPNGPHQRMWWAGP